MLATIFSMFSPKKNKFRGSLVGAAVGDALGMPTEYISDNELESNFGGRVASFQKASDYHPCSHLDAGQYTDDTQQVILLAESLRDKSGFDIHDFGKRMGEWAHKCRTEPGFNRYAGGTSISASMKLYEGVSPFETGVRRPTCGSAMRIAPIGLFYHKDMVALEQYAKDASAITHTHPAAIDSAVLISYMIASGINGVPVDEAVFEASSLLRSDLLKNVNFVIAGRDRNPKDVAAVIGSSESSYETVPMALHCFLHSPDDFEKTVIEAANLTPGDTDSIACIAGAISGAYNGLNNIPKRFKTVEDYDDILKLADALLERSQ